MKKYVIIVAGGKGLRMGGEIPKQFLPIGGKPVLMRTVEAFYQAEAEIEIVLVLPHEQQDYWRELCHQYDFQIPYILADGGQTRFHSVQNGLRMIPDGEADALVAVHDGVRPFVSAQVIQTCFDEAARQGAVVPVLDMVDSVRRLSDDGGSKAGIYGLGKAVEITFADLKGHISEMERKRNLLKELIEEKIDGLKINSPENGVCHILNISFEDIRGEVLLHYLEQKNVYVSTGSACSSKKKGSHVLNAMGLSFLRQSCS